MGRFDRRFRRALRKASKSNPKAGEDYSKQCDAMLERARGWRMKNPDDDVLVQFNFPETMAVIGTISQAIENHYVSTNAAGLAIIKAMGPWPKGNEPTVMMVRMVLEHFMEGIQPGKPQVCAWCGAINECNTPLYKKGDEPKERPVPAEGSLLFCVACGEWTELENEQTGHRVLPERISQLPEDLQKLIRSGKEAWLKLPPPRT